MAEIKLGDIKPNSNKYKKDLREGNVQEVKKVNAIVGKDALVKPKKTLGQKFKDAFIKEDVMDVKDYLLWDCIIPGIKFAVFDVLSMMFWNKHFDGGSKSSAYDSRYTNYSSSYKGRVYEGRSLERNSRDQRRYTDKLDYREIILVRKVDAEDIVKEMRRRIREEGSVSVNELFSLVGESGEFTDNYWGWMYEGDIGMRYVREGWLIDVAVPVELRS